MPRLQILHHKSYHPYLEKNKQRVREDEAKAAQDEAEKEQARIDQASKARLRELRRKAGSVSPSPPPEDLPSTTSSREGVNGGLLERHRKNQLRKEKEEKRRKERLDFDFPSETLRKDRKRDQEEKEYERSLVRSSDDQMDQSVNLWEGGRHLNLFADLEKEMQSSAGQSLETIAKKSNSSEPKPDAFTVFLARPDRETKPWYTDKEMKRVEEKEISEEAEIRRARDKRKDVRSKIRHDPLTDINSKLDTQPKPRYTPHPPTPKDPHLARQARESSERQRALALIASRKSNAVGNWDETPSSAAGWSERIEREKDRAGHRFYPGRY